MFVTDYILNNQGYGEVGSVVGRRGFDPGYMRPYFDVNGVRVVDVRRGACWDDKKRAYTPRIEKVRISDLLANGVSSPVFNATALRREEWILFDQAVLRATRQRLKAVGDLMSMGLTYSVPGMSKMILEHETMNDPGSALVDMNGLTEGNNDGHFFQLEGLPLPITHSDFQFSERELQVSRNTPGSALDTLRAEAAGRRIAERLEQTLIGSITGTTYGGSSTQTGGYGRASTVQGYLNFTNRNTKTNLTTPTGANPNATLDDVLEMRELLYADGFYGPFMLYHSTDWDVFLDADYAFVNGTGWAANPVMTLRDRLRRVEGITDVRRLDYMTGTAYPFTMLLVQMTPEVVRMVNGMEVTTVQWEEKGGMSLRFKVMCIKVPQLRADYNGNCGIVHGNV